MQKYNIVKKVGQGGFGKAYIVSSKSDSKYYIMKTMDYDEWAFKEARVLQSLNHQNIVKYVDSFREGNNFIVIMEYADSGDLSQKIYYHNTQKSNPLK